MGDQKVVTTSRVDSSSTGIPYLVRTFALAIPAILVGAQIAAWLGFFKVIRDGHADFRQLYTAGYMVRSGYRHELYDYNTQLRLQNEVVSWAEIPLPFVRPAYQALLFVPFSLLRYRTAYVLFLIFNLALLALTVHILAARMAHLSTLYRWLPLALFITFVPTAAALMQGQDSLLLLVLLAAAVVCFDRGHSVTAGILVGLGMFKFQVVVPIVLFFLLLRRWRFLLGFMGAFLVVGSLSLAIVGALQTKAYISSLMNMGLGTPAAIDQLRYPLPVHLMPNLHGLVVGLANNSVSGFWTTLITVFLSTALFGCVALQARKIEHEASLFLVAISLSTVVSFYLFIHDLTILLIPITSSLDRFVEATMKGKVSKTSQAQVSALMFVSPACIAFVPSHIFVICLPELVFLIRSAGLH